MVTKSLNSLELYGQNFQTKVIASLLTDKKFLIKIHDVISDEYFQNTGNKWIINQILEYYTKFHTTISIDVLKVEVKKIENEILQISIKEQLREAYNASTDNDLEYIEQEFGNFCKNQQLKKALLSSVDLLNAGDYDSIRTLVNNAIKAGNNEDVGHMYDKDIETRYREDNRSQIKFPWPIFNTITNGGYGKGDLILLFGSPGGGKSWGAIAMAAEAAKQGKNVIYYSLELSESYVGLRFDSYFTGISVEEITKHRNEVNAIMATIPGRIVIKGYSPKRASLGTIEHHIEQLKDQEDFVADVVFIDYLDLLKNKKNRKERKDDTDDVYTDCKGLARELDIPFISPSQANRSGAEKEILEGTHIAGSYDKLMIGDIVVSLARGRKDKLNGTGKFHFMKNRYGPDGVTYAALINTKNGHFEVEEEEFDVNDDYDKPKRPSNNIANEDKEQLKDLYFKLNN